MAPGPGLAAAKTRHVHVRCLPAAASATACSVRLWAVACAWACGLCRVPPTAVGALQARDGRAREILENQQEITSLLLESETENKKPAKFLRLEV